MDLSAFEAGLKAGEQGIDVQINWPGTDKATGITIRVASYESERVMARARDIGNRVKKQRAKDPLKIEAIEDEEARLLALDIAATVGWSGIEESDQPIPFNEDNVQRIYLKFPFIVDQVRKAGSDRTLFFGEPPKPCVKPSEPGSVTTLDP